MLFILDMIQILMSNPLFPLKLNSMNEIIVELKVPISMIGCRVVLLYFLVAALYLNMSIYDRGIHISTSE